MNIVKVLRKSVALLLGLVGAVGGRAQIENLPISEDVGIDKLFVGLLTNTRLLFDEGNYSGLGTFQFGARAGIWVIPKKLRVRSFGVIKLISGADSRSFTSYEIIVTPSNMLEMKIGIMATPTTELRPNPTTWQSQVETNAESTIIGGRPGAKLRYTFTKNFNITYGFHNHGGAYAHHLKFKKGNLSFSTYLEKDDVFTALKWSNTNLDFVFTQFRGLTATSAIIAINQKIKTYIDMEYEDNVHTLKFGEIGLRSHFGEKDFLRGFFSIAYNISFNSLEGGLYLHI